jgi:hypothetical protein
MANEYVSATQLKATLNMSGETYADADITAACAAASRAIDNICRRRFYPDSDATQIRYYTPLAPGLVEIDDLITLTTVKVDRDGDGTFEETWTNNSDFVLEPLNAAADGWPYERLRVHHRTTRGWWPGHHHHRGPSDRSVQVTGKFGWTTAPYEVQDAASIYASRLLKRKREAPFGVTALGVEGTVARIARTDPDVLALLEPFKRTRPFM